MSLSPASQSGKFQRKLDAALGMVKDHERFQEAMLDHPAHERFAPEVAESPDLLKSWSRKIESELWVKAYERHPLVQSASREERTRILSPSATASSSSPHTCCLPEGGIWRLQFANHRCAIAEPLCRWRQANTPRRDTTATTNKTLSGTNMAFKAVVMDIQGDWAEFVLRCRFPTWSSKHHPCFTCNLTLEDVADNKTDGWVGRTTARHAMSGPLFRILLHIETSFCC